MRHTTSRVLTEYALASLWALAPKMSLYSPRLTHSRLQSTQEFVVDAHRVSPSPELNACIHTLDTCGLSVSLRTKNLLDLAVAAMVWWSFGWGIAYGGQTETGEFNQFFGPGSFFTRGEGFADEAGNYGTTEGYNWALWLFQVHASVRACDACIKCCFSPKTRRMLQANVASRMLQGPQPFLISAHRETTAVASYCSRKSYPPQARA